MLANLESTSRKPADYASVFVAVVNVVDEF